MKRALFFFLLWLVPFSSFAEGGETLKILQDLIRIDTSNPPGNEIQAARFVRDLLAKDGIDAEIIESKPGRGNLIARLKGDGSKPAMILMGHLDVVPADPKEWDVPPFSAEIKDGLLWGRGSLDMKSLDAMEIETLLRLKRDKTPLAGDVLLILAADEEAGGHEGAEFLVKNHWDKIEAKYLLNEGSVGVRKEGLPIYPIQVAEKGVAWMKLTAHGTSGHGSMPTADNAVTLLAKTVAKLADYRFPVQKTDVLETFLQRMSARLPWYKRAGIQLLFAPVIGPVVQKIAMKVLAKDKAVKAILSNTVSPTMLSAGYKVNVIPAEATAEIDGRILPGETPDTFLKTVRQLAGDRVDVELTKGSIPNESDFNTAYFRVIEDVLKRQDPEAVTAPMMSAGATDSRFFREKGVLAYGIIPLLLNEDLLEGLHGKNERIPADQVEKGTQIVYNIVRKMQGTP